MAAIKSTDIELGKELGRGGFGTVFRGLWKPENKHVAIKILHKVDFQEVDILKQLEHPNIVTLYGFVHEETYLMIVMELCEIGSLRSFLEQHADNPLSPPLIHDWMLQAALPIDYLRHHKVQHMDIKTDNYIITSNMILKLTDFGLSQNVENTRSFSSEAGSWRWMSPERLRDHKLSPKFDIYALALVFWCFFMRVLPYAEYPSEFTVAEAVCTHKVRPPLPPNCPKQVWELIEACWHDDRSKRPDIRDVIVNLEHHRAVFVQYTASPYTEISPANEGLFQPHRRKRVTQPNSTDQNTPFTRTEENGDKQQFPGAPLPGRRDKLQQQEVPSKEDIEDDVYFNASPIPLKGTTYLKVLEEQCTSVLPQQLSKHSLSQWYEKRTSPKPLLLHVLPVQGSHLLHGAQQSDEKSRSVLEEMLSKSEVQDYIKAGCMLNFAADAIRSYVGRKIKDIHSDISEEINTEGANNSGHSCYCSAGKKPVDPCIHQKWGESITRLHGSAKNIHWTNVDPRKFPEKPWEMAKLFMNSLGKKAAKYDYDEQMMDIYICFAELDNKLQMF